MEFYSLCLFLCVSTSPLLTCFAQDYVVEVLVVLDSDSQALWKANADVAGNTVDQEVKSVMYEVNERFRGLMPYGLDVAIRLANDQIVYVDGSIVDHITFNDNGTQDSSFYMGIIFSSFEHWANGKDFDVAVFLTGYPLLQGRSLIGQAVVDGACYGGVSVLALNFPILVTEVTHSIGRILGLQVDGRDNGCDGEEGYIMSERMFDDVENRNDLFFSNCSLKSLKQILPEKDCLRPDNTPDIKAPRLGQLVGAHEICRRAGEYHATHLPFDLMDINMCESVPCIRPTGIWRPVNTPSGLQCGPSKSCHRGRCLTDMSVSSTWNEHCPFGDVPRFGGSNITTCQQVKDQDLCDDTIWRANCCETCS